MSSADEVRTANDAFYEAFRDRDFDRMDALWARHAPVACMHPGMGALIGRERVMESWRGILNNDSAPRIRCSRVQVHLLDGAAYVTCLEGTPGRAPTLIATNVFTHEQGEWKLVHHHAAPLSPTERPEETVPEDPDPQRLN